MLAFKNHCRTALVLSAFCLLPISSLSASAHPHIAADNPKIEKQAKKPWPYFGGKTAEDTIDNQDMKTIKPRTSLTEDSPLSHKIEQHFEEASKKMRMKIRKMEAHAEKTKDSLSKKVDIKIEGENGTRILRFENGDEMREIARDIETMVSQSGLLSNLADIVASVAEDIEIETDDNGLSLRFDGETLGRMKRETRRDSNDSLQVEALGRNVTIDKQVIKKDGKTKTRIVIEMDGSDDVDIDIAPKYKSGE